MNKFGVVEKSFYRNGYHCIIVFTKNGVYNGYIGIDKNNKLFGEGYSKPLKFLKSKNRNFNGNYIGLFCQSFENVDYLPPELYFNVHGGFTYAGYMEQEFGYNTNDELWYFGFDCGHCDDGHDYEKAFKLGLITLNQLNYLKGFETGQYREFRNIEYVQNCLNLVADEIYEFRKKEERKCFGGYY